jgi:hypothetical protein
MRTRNSWPQRLNSLRKKGWFSRDERVFVNFSLRFAWVFPPRLPTVRWVPPCLSLLYASLGISFAMRTRLHAAAAKRNIQSTRRRLRNFVLRSPATNLIHPKAFSTNLRFR